MPPISPLILVIDDEAPVRKFLRVSLVNNGFRYVDAASGKEGITQAKAHNPDLVLLDLGLPDMDGLGVTKELRQWTTTPIVVISARGQEADKIDALDSGADDYVTKPFSTGELMARIRVALRHAARTGTRTGSNVAETALIVGDIRMDLEKRLVYRGQEEVHLTPIEYKLLAELMKNAGKVITHRQLLREVWGPTHGHETQYLRVYMSQLRNKLEEDVTRPRYLVTEPGVGYRLKSDT